MKKSVMMWAAGACACLAFGLATGCSRSSGENVATTAAALTATSFSGEGVALRATVAGITTTVADTGPLPAAGGTLSATAVSASIPGVLTSGTLSASADGSGNQSLTTAGLEGLSVGLLGLGLSATAVSSTATATCGATLPISTGSTTIANLVLNGTKIVVSGAVDQTITVPLVGTIIINEQTSSTTATTTTITVNALHIRLLSGLVNVVIGSSTADVVCMTSSSSSSSSTSTSTSSSSSGTSTSTSSSSSGTSTSTSSSSSGTSTSSSSSSSSGTLNPECTNDGNNVTLHNAGWPYHEDGTCAGGPYFTLAMAEALCGGDVKYIDYSCDDFPASPPYQTDNEMTWTADYACCVGDN